MVEATGVDNPDALLFEAMRAAAIGYISGLCMLSGAVVVQLTKAEFVSAIGVIAPLSGVALAVGLYVFNFGLFNISKVTHRLTSRGVPSAPEVTYGRIDALLRHLWVWGWSFGLAESALLLLATQ